MKQVVKFIFTLLMNSAALTVYAQDVRTLVQEGIQLNNARNYTGAIEKYKAALSAEPDNVSANYQMAFSLQALGKGPGALPYLQKVVGSGGASPAVVSSAYGLMGGIYDQAGQAQKAIDSYQLGIKADSSSYSLHYGLGLACSRNHQYAEAETAAISAIRLDPKQSGAVRLYALSAFHQNNRAAALLGFCRFLAMEPNGLQSGEAYGNLQHILQGGVLKPEPGIMVPHHMDANTNALNLAVTKATAAPVKPGADQLAAHLQAVFRAVGKEAAQQPNNNAFFRQMAAYYAKLAQSPYMPVFAHTIRQSTDKADTAWLQSHAQQVAAFEAWEKAEGN